MKRHHPTLQPSRTGGFAQRGFGLIEIMVAMLIGLIMLAGITTVFINNKQNYKVQTTLARLQENGRYGIDLITRDLRRAGYWGGNAEPGAVVGKQDPASNCATGNTTWGRMIEQRIFGLDDSNAGYACIPDDDYTRGDILVTRYAATDQATSLSSNRTYLRTSLFEGRAFQGSEDSSNAIADTPQSTRELVAHAFYIGPSDVQCPAGSTVPALFWETLDDNGRPNGVQQVVGAEQLQVRYGIDADGNDSVEQYLDANAIGNWDQVAAVRIWLLLRAECPEAGFTHSNSYSLGDQTYAPSDHYRRQLYTATVMLRN